MNVAGEHIWGMRLGALSGLAMLVAVGCTGSVETSPVGGDADGSELELRNGGENTYTGTLDANGTSTRRRGIRIRSNGVLTLTLEWDNPSADLRLRLKQGRSVVADGTATEEAVQVIQRNVKSGEYYTAEVTARSGASSYALTVQLDKVGTPPPTTSCGDKVCNGTETCSTCAADCGACPPPPPTTSCGDKVCNGTETCSTCAADCGACPPPPASCGDKVCNGTETCSSCAADCGACPPPPASCGDKVCNGTETCSSCAADCGACPPPPTSAGCDTSGPIGLQATPGYKSPLSSLVTVGNVVLAGETISGKRITGSVRGYGTIKDSWIEAQTWEAVQNKSNQPLILEDVTIGGPATYGDLGVSSYGSGGVVLRRVSVQGYADCFRNGPFDIENSSCITTLQTSEDHNDGYQAYMSGQVDVKIRCSEISSIGTSNTNGGIFHADGSQEHFTLQNLKIRVNHNYCIRLHSASKYGELPSGDTVDDGRVLRMENIDCAGGPVWIDGLPVDFWSNVMVNGKLVSGP